MYANYRFDSIDPHVRMNLDHHGYYLVVHRVVLLFHVVLFAMIHLKKILLNVVVMDDLNQFVV